VRGKLARYGVRDADLPDLCHEVFLIVHDKIDVVPEVGRVDLWLREICRRVAAAYRRRSGYKLEVLGGGADPDLECQGADLEAEQGSGTERREQLALVRRALHRLDVESRDLLALHDVGQMPLTDLAKLVAHDRKTVRKRLELARRRVSRLVSCEEERAGADAGEGGRPTPPEPASITVGVAKGKEHGCAGRLEVVHATANRKVGAFGNVALGTWAGVISPEIVDTVFYLAPTTLERCGGEIAYLAMIEPTMVAPSLLARQRIVEALEVVGPYINAFATVLLGGTSAISEPILRGMMLLARPRFPIRFFTAMEPAAEWLCSGYARGPDGPMRTAELISAAQRLRCAGCA
jgi:RNA polymerase sigma-70 factor (ECF subfamily)